MIFDLPTLPAAVQAMARLGSQERDILRHDFAYLMSGKTAFFPHRTSIQAIGVYEFFVAYYVVGRSVFCLGFCEDFGPARQQLVVVIDCALYDDLPERLFARC